MIFYPSKFQGFFLYLRYRQWLDESLRTGKICQLPLLSRVTWWWPIPHFTKPWRRSDAKGMEIQSSNTLYLLKIKVAKSNLLFSISNPSSKNERKLCLGRLGISWRSVISFIFMKLITITKIPNEIWPPLHLYFLFTDFQFRPTFKIMNKKLTDFVHSYEDWTILKISSEI